MPIIRGTTPAIQVRFSNIEIPDISSVKAFYYTYTQADAILDDLSAMVTQDYLAYEQGLISIPSTVSGSTATYEFGFTSAQETFDGIILTITSSAVSKIEFTRGGESMTVFDDSADPKWSDLRYRSIKVPHDDTDDFDTAISGGLDRIVQSASVYTFDPDVLETKDDGYYVTTYLDQTATNSLAPEIELVGTVDVVFNDLVPGSAEHKRGTTKTFSEMVCDAVLSGEVLTGESNG